HKPSLRSAGWDVPGQTEMLQKLTGSKSVGMLMAAEMTDRGSPLRVLLATTHHPLREAINLLTEELLLEQIVLLSEALQSDWGLVAPQIAICGLNPHASDDGLFGDEETMILSPAIERAREMGTNVTGPFPADTVFYRALTGNFDAIVAPYHDVGMAAFKTAAFGRGVNVTLGLPFVRTSPDHGTAFDIAGTSSANATSMVEAVRLAIHLTQNRFSKSSLHD
ncbi:MAG: 4-hydroxythreonine-4-phosphate dehydrogenase PdxA, partial [bacterium]